MHSALVSIEEVTGAFAVSRDGAVRLAAYVALLQRWQRRLNLIGPGSEAEIWRRHVADSLQLVRFVPETATTLVDLGSGAGFPGLVLAIALAQRGLAVHLVESSAKKAAFLREAIRVSDAPALVHHSRIEDLDAAEVGRVDIVTARALAPLGRLLGLAAPFLAKGAVGIFPKGQHVDKELTEAAKCWSIVAEKRRSRIDPLGSILIVREAKHVRAGESDRDRG
jgi:16S rRNA (guanine527-N7)-methyltransferase